MGRFFLFSLVIAPIDANSSGFTKLEHGQGGTQDMNSEEGNLDEPTICLQRTPTTTVLVLSPTQNQ